MTRASISRYFLCSPRSAVACIRTHAFHVGGWTYYTPYINLSPFNLIMLLIFTCIIKIWKTLDLQLFYHVLTRDWRMLFFLVSMSPTTCWHVLTHCKSVVGTCTYETTILLYLPPSFNNKKKATHLSLLQYFYKFWHVSTCDWKILGC